MNERAEVDRVLAGGGEAGVLARAVDWSKTAIGPVQGWSQAQKSAAALVLHNHSGMLLWWGPQFIQIYNDAYRPVLGDKHPRAMGQPFSECWAEVFHIVGPMAERPFRGGPASTSDDLPLLINRKVVREETHFRLAYSPVPDETVQPTGIGGVLATVTEITEEAYGERQLRTLRELGARSAESQTAEEACAAAAATLRDNPWDVPFALFYLIDPDGKRARRAASVGFDEATLEAAAADEVALVGADRCVWPIGAVAQQQQIVTLDDLSSCPVPLPTSPWSDRPRSAIVLPLASPGQSGAYGVLVCGISPHRLLDTGYRTFFELAAAQIVTAIRNARALEEERKRAEALAQIDRAKTAFFSNISHEFRTPLTLMLGPTTDALDGPERALRGSELETVHRNELRLLKLVNTLLDFSRIEAGRVRAVYQPTDLAALTRDLASAFRSAIERGGLRFEVDCPPLPRPVHVDREMWEKIVLNLLSNALKFTFEGSVRVALRAAGEGVELEVADTGTGIPAAELPRVFERFHRIEGARARTHEGSGIGLALVHDLTRLHGGQVTVTSEEGRGTTFIVSVPFAGAHLPAAPPLAAQASTAVRAESFVAEALRWLPGEPPPELLPPTENSASTAPTPAGARVLFADDNADMREYVGRLLRQHWQVETVTDGAEALRAARVHRPDVILTDVMMPRLDGVGLLRALRGDPALATIPVIMLSARAGEEARIEGLDAGADDYLVKPFSARELVARVGSQIALARMREGSDRERAALLEREQTARREAESATRAKDEFLAMLGHELRNPLSPILTAVQLMRLRGQESREVDIVDRQVRYLVRLVDDLLDVSRITRGKIELRRERVELARVVVRGLETASPLLEQRRQQVDFEVPAEGLPVDGDPDRLAQVVSNLLTNASKYSEPGTRIAIHAQAAGGSVRLRVIDHGIGIAPEMQERIFDIFIQQQQALDRAKGGLGLGLTIVRSLVEMHGGSVEARSAGLGQGSEFIVTLPLATPVEDYAALAPTSLPHPLAPRRPADARRVLIVDDNDDAAQSIADVLRELGHDVHVAHDGPSALRVASQFRPDVCLLDIGLPVMDGYELAERLRSSHTLAEGARIIALTGYGQDADRRRSTEAGFSAHMVKPVDLDALTSVVGN